MTKREAFKGVVWPRESTNARRYRYAIVGVLMTDQPIEGLDPNETILCGSVGGMATAVEGCARGEVSRLLGDATEVLQSLDEIRPIEQQKDARSMSAHAETELRSLALTPRQLRDLARDIDDRIHDMRIDEDQINGEAGYDKLAAWGALAEYLRTEAKRREAAK